MRFNHALVAGLFCFYTGCGGTTPGSDTTPDAADAASGDSVDDSTTTQSTTDGVATSQSSADD